MNDLPAILYSGDHAATRRKLCGLTLIEQMLKSARSVRRVLGFDVSIYFAHTRPLPSELDADLCELAIRPFLVKDYIESDYPLSNKVAAGRDFPSAGGILFLDCDTIVHQPFTCAGGSDLLVAYDVLDEISAPEFQRFYDLLGIELPCGRFSDCPARDYYLGSKDLLFPNFNSGVYFVSEAARATLYAEWERLLKVAYQAFNGESWDFYIEQMTFAAAIVAGGLQYEIFEKGINFICTPRAPALSTWPRSRIVVEHYAGDSSRPLVFSGDHIDVVASGIAAPGLPPRSEPG